MRVTKTARLVTGLLVAGLIAVSCSVDRTPLAPPPSADLLGGLTSTVTKVAGTLLSCSPLPYASNSAVIGPSGGVLQIGPHVLVVPQGALASNVTIRGDAPSETVRSVRLYPAGLRFAKPATLTLSYQSCSLVSNLLPKKIAFTTDDLRILEILLSLDMPLTQTVSGQVNHFSRYAVSY